MSEKLKYSNYKSDNEVADIEGIACSRIAYLNLGDVISNLKADGYNGPFALGDLIISSINRELAIAAAKAAGISESEITFRTLVEYSDLDDSHKDIILGLQDYMFDWKIVDVHDTRVTNGFYACCIEMSEEKAMIAFRGSESMNSLEFKRNWFEANFGLLNSRGGTWQQEEADRCINKFFRNGSLNKYKTLFLGGHSKGGNLAAYALISLANDEKRRALFKKIKMAYNYDGPGFSKEFLEAHADACEIAASKIKHLKWSAVGYLLYGVPGEKEERWAIDEKLHTDNLLDRIKYKLIGRHSSKSLCYDNKGMAQKGMQDIMAQGLSFISKAVDIIIPEWLTIEAFAVTDWLFDKLLSVEYGDHINFGKPAWAERSAENGSILGMCTLCIKNMLRVFKEGALSVKKEFSLNNPSLKLAAAGANGTIAPNVKRGDGRDER